jgi:Holliday junction resolvase - archaeal type
MSKAKGSRREREVRDFLLQRGFKVCKAGASLGEWDLIAVNGHVFLLVQVKSNRFCYPAEREALEAFEAPFNARKLQAQAADRKGVAFRVFQEGSWLNVAAFTREGPRISDSKPLSLAWFKPRAGSKLREELAL